MSAVMDQNSTRSAGAFGIIEVTKYECRSGVGSTLRRGHTLVGAHDMCSVRIPLNSRKYPGLFAIVDDDDADRVLAKNWFPAPRRNKIYACANSGSWRRGTHRTILLHRFILGDLEDGVEVDHINGDGLDNRKENLRVATASENGANRTGYQGRTSKYKGVCFWRNKWRAQIGIRGTNRHIGSFDNEVDAAKAYDEVAQESFGEFAVLNFPKTKGVSSG